MIYTNCYYYLKGKAIFVSQCVMEHGEMFLYVYNCERIIDSQADIDNIYNPIGDPILIHPDELSSAKNMCINCLSCKYLSVENPIGLMNGEQKVKILSVRFMEKLLSIVFRRYWRIANINILNIHMRRLSLSESRQ